MSRQILPILMKTRFAILFAATALAFGLVLQFGCATTNTFQNNSGKFLATTAATVDAAMHGWAVWVASGKASPGDEAQVKAIYQQYQGSMMLATNAYTLAVKLSDPSIFVTPSNNLFAV